MISLDVNNLDFSKLKQLRAQKGWSLRKLAAESEVSASYISMVERGMVTPTLPRIMRICEALGVTLGHFGLPHPRPVVVHPQEQAAAVFHDAHAKVTILASPHDAAISMFVFEIDPKVIQPDTMIRHSYPEYGYVVAGCLRVIFEDEEVVAYEGDYVRVDAGRAHRFVNPGPTISRSVWASPVTFPADPALKI